MELNCPVCDKQLTATESGARCESCNQDFKLEARCPECHKPLEVLKACGAVDYFCQNGHGLISKKRVEFVPVAP
ncbi:zinc ribbon domain-containing protein [Enterobacteriaceae bacterium H20N1]|uniref:Zinc ribbon domain-containing protein n=1 Tax=Dryocola boscaweniae TaxID=2925397 RepID=A0A9X3APS4_9ENTR|nr:zinc ribbon domain-containing protein [Dryocola boscaweniae]MCT4701465.1 zinc ribbon domain-containing protein [Dryocola boscaweniae]MCT4718624.1 zinc ribbon domain-containing protein [Dryocola boscaweniae]